MLNKKLNGKELKFEERDVPTIKELLQYAESFLDNKISKRQLIDNMEDVCSVFLDHEDRELLSFKGLWSEVTDIEDEINEGKSTQKDIDDYVGIHINIMKESCKTLIERYTPILER